MIVATDFQPRQVNSYRYTGGGGFFSTSRSLKRSFFHMSPSFTIFSLSFSFFFMLIIISFGLCCDPGDRAALLDFSNAFDTPLWPRPANVSAADCCRWSGITCSNGSAVNGSSSSNSYQRVIRLALANTTLGGPIPSSVARLSYLQTLVLWNMTLTGPLPSLLGRLTYLQRLNLGYNRLSGPIPEELYHLQSLQVIGLIGNSISGSLRPSIGNLSSLRILALADNQLSGVIPDVFLGLKNLQYLILSDNRLSGSLPSSLWSCSDLRAVIVYGNNMSGRLDVNFTGLWRLQSLSLRSNNFTISISKSIRLSKSLELLDLVGNKLQGNMPWEFLPPSLRLVSLASNRFFNITGALLSFQRCSNLTVLDLDGSFKKEAMPQNGIVGFPNLKSLTIKNSELAGMLPMWLSKLDKLLVLDLSGNYLTGEIPISLARLKSLSHTEGREEPFISSYFESEDLMFQFSIKPSLNISNNLLSGNTWIHLTNLTHVVDLDLSHNFLSGSIPADFSKMKRLQYLDLSWNRISGTIPSSLKQLTYMSHFCVANNMLHGDVPTGSQFSTFPSNCFDGNPGLCYAGKRGCYPPPPSATKPDDQIEESHRKVIDMGVPFAIGVSIGYATTILVSIVHYCWTRRKKPSK